ncbi:PilN domain-containing protein [Parahaliea sp. F7430]|uniref:PilN domain-containing protein n=1 Tax=Sediminihaliea albiluteola TaxID=2758564 RepID=A0A7W2YK96_9GAMM|nr:PilN domain-containing protein [Sediminihaliea albiluteola]MBA6413945.1 PilN domain-containing protein [Sediminihaliea albiluteola]
MAKINLLPWRDERREEQKKEFLMLLGMMLLLAVALLILGDRYVNAQIDHQRARNNHLSQNIKVLDKKVAEIAELERKRDQLLDRMQVIQELQGNRPVIVRILDQLVRTVPDGVFYTRLISQAKDISITGVAESNNRVSSLMRRLDASDWLTEPNLDSVRAAPQYGDQATTFQLKVKVQLPDSGNGSGS